MVKEGYRLAMELEDIDATVAIFPWNILWNLHILRKVHLFLWRLINNVLPCKVNLKYRHVDVDEVCLVCGVASETTMHVLYFCPTTQYVWILSSVGWSVISSLESWLTNLFTIGS